MQMRLAVAAVTALALAIVASSAAAGPRFSALDPGGPANLSEKVPVQYVFVGYEPSQVSESAFRAQLPASYKPVVRSRLWYGVTELLGIHYTYDSKVVYTDSAYENAFFSALSGLATPAPRTLFQDAYNAQVKNVLDVGQNHFIDAPSVERWLYRNPPAGIDPSRNTVFFVNWYGRPDFKFHVYTKFGEPDPDTGFDFGRNRESRKLIAWGGTPATDEETGFGASSRVWFYDLSAGPESWTDNWNVDNADVDGDGRADYRMPPIWEYTARGFRAPAALSSDLGKVGRYVAINLLFTSSPLYPPYITPNSQPATVNLDLNTYEGWKGVDASTRYQKQGLVLQETRELDRIGYNTDQQDIAFEGQAKNCYTLWVADNPCYPNLPYPGFANLFLYNAQTQGTWRNGGGEYEAGLFNYSTAENRASGFLGFADDNYYDGTQSGIFNFVSPGVVAAGYGLSTTQIHEHGHHTGMSHPHDGYDYETGVDYGGAGSTYFAWSGDESNSMMSYIDVNWDFSQFDLDNNNRFKAAAFMKLANAIAADVLASSNWRAGESDLRRADDEFKAAQAAMAAHDYVAAYDRAKSGYLAVRTAAAKAGVAVSSSQIGWFVQPPFKGKGVNKKEYSFQDRYGVGTHRGRP
jgi:hypothetical protein